MALLIALGCDKSAAGAGAKVVVADRADGGPVDREPARRGEQRICLVAQRRVHIAVADRRIAQKPIVNINILRLSDGAHLKTEHPKGRGGPGGGGVGRSLPFIRIVCEVVGSGVFEALVVVSGPLADLRRAVDLAAIRLGAIFSAKEVRLGHKGGGWEQALAIPRGRVRCLNGGTHVNRLLEKNRRVRRGRDAAAEDESVEHRPHHIVPLHYVRVAIENVGGGKAIVLVDNARANV